jgi:hypothetical protein
MGLLVPAAPTFTNIIPALGATVAVQGSFVGARTPSTGTSVVCTLPTSVSGASFVLAAYINNGAANGATVPDGWVRIASQADTGAAGVVQVFTKPCNGETAVTVTVPNASVFAYQSLVVNGTYDPISTAKTSVNGAAATSVVGTAVTPFQANSVLVSAYGSTSNTGTWTLPGGQSGGSTVNLAVGAERLSGVSSTGTRTATNSQSATWMAIQLVFMPIGGYLPNVAWHGWKTRLDLTGKRKAKLYVSFGRYAASALTRSAYLAVRPTNSGASREPNRTYDVISSMQAVNQTTISTTAGLQAGANQVTLASATGFAADQTCMLTLAGARTEFLKIADVNGTVVTFDEPFRIGHNASDRITWGADCFSYWIPGNEIWEIWPVNNSGQVMVVTCDAVIDNGDSF